MGSTSTCTPEKYGLPYKLDMRSNSFSMKDMRSFSGGKGSISDEFGSLSGRNKGVWADLGLAAARSTMDADNFKINSIIAKANTMHAHPNPTDIKALKKPDKALPCPRCNSLDTKFCYYNNYNVNQPRHFCKGCQRYWTAGGTLRNVAIGAGRRKRKHASLESDSQDSTPEDCISHDISPMKVSGNTENGYAKSEFAHGGSQVVKHQMFSFERIPYTALSNPQSSSMQASSFSEYVHSKRIASSHDKVEPLCNSDTFKEQSSTFYEYLRPKHIVAHSEKEGAACNSHDHACDPVYLEHLRKGTLNLRMDLQHNDCSDMGSKLFPTTSSDMQASNESGCASSLTTQAVSVDACVTTDGKSDAMDSEVTKEGDELDKGSSHASKDLQTSFISPCKTRMDGGGSATSSFGHVDSSSVATKAPTWKEPSENPAFKPAWPMVSPAISWGPSPDKTHLWGFPWGTTASVVEAAKAAMIPNMGLLQKQKVELNRSSEMRLWVPKTLRIKDADEAARSSIWSTLGIKDRQGSVLSEKVEAVFQCHAKTDDAPATQSQHASPVALSQSMAFQESS